MNNTEWHDSSSYDEPLNVDLDSDKEFVIIRKNIKKETLNEQDIYNYEEKMIPRIDWEVYEDIISASLIIDKNSADIDYIAMMADIDIPV